MLEERNLDLKFPDGFITSVIFRASLDCLVRGPIPDEVIDLVFKTIDENASLVIDKSESTVSLQRIIAQYYFSKDLEHTPFTLEQVEHRFKTYMFEGGKAWLRRWPNDHHLIG